MLPRIHNQATSLTLIVQTRPIGLPPYVLIFVKYLSRHSHWNPIY